MPARKMQFLSLVMFAITATGAWLIPLIRGQYDGMAITTLLLAIVFLVLTLALEPNVLQEEEKKQGVLIFDRHPQ